MVKHKGLGAGVGSLLFGDEEEEEILYFSCDIEKISANKHQPRTFFGDNDLEDLTLSIKQNGVIQPLIVVKNTQSNDERYELIAGERRLRASKLAGLTEVPVVVKTIEKEEDLLELAIVENVQRTDLNPIEEAEAYKKLIDTFGYTQEQTALKVGKKRTTISNLIRLLKLPHFIKADISDNTLTEGHARCLLRLIDDQVRTKEVRDLIIKNSLSVRQTEKLVKKLLSEKNNTKENPKTTSTDISTSYQSALVNQLENKLSSKVKLHQNGSRGTIEVEYYSVDDLERLIGLITDEN